MESGANPCVGVDKATFMPEGSQGSQAVYPVEGSQSLPAVYPVVRAHQAVYPVVRAHQPSSLQSHLVIWNTLYPMVYKYHVSIQRILNIHHISLAKPHFLDGSKTVFYCVFCPPPSTTVRLLNTVLYDLGYQTYYVKFLAIAYIQIVTFNIVDIDSRLNQKQ